MCLAIVSHDHTASPDWPVFVAANRDEYFDRSSLPPHVTTRGDTLVLAPSDLRAGGTWIGINDKHLFAVITNRSDLDQNAPPGARSRGLLVSEVLAAGTLDSALAVLRDSEQQASAPFNLIVGDVHRLFIAERGPQSFELTQLRSGAHVVSNKGAVNDDEVGEVKRARTCWTHAMARGDDPWSAGRDLLSLAEPDAEAGLPSILKSGDGRGTVSSTIFALGRDRRARFMHADGPPHVTDYVEYAVPVAVPS